MVKGKISKLLNVKSLGTRLFDSGQYEVYKYFHNKVLKKDLVFSAFEIIMDYVW